MVIHNNQLNRVISFIRKYCFWILPVILLSSSNAQTFFREGQIAFQVTPMVLNKMKISPATESNYLKSEKIISFTGGVITVNLSIKMFH